MTTRTPPNQSLQPTPVGVVSSADAGHVVDPAWLSFCRSAAEGFAVTKFRLTRIEPPDWATHPDLSITGVTVAEYAAIQQHRDRLLQAVHDEVEAYLNTAGLYGEGHSFPDRLRMNGAYYVGSESYIAHRDPTWFQISISCRCLERPKAGVGRDDDYLGLEVWLKCVPERWASFEVFRNTDSSSI